MQQEVKGISITNEETLAEIRQTYERIGYILDPHTAVGVAAARRYKQNDDPIIVNATAHPGKFPEIIKRAINIDIELPEQLSMLMHKQKQTTKIAADYTQLQSILLRFY